MLARLFACLCCASLGYSVSQAAPAVVYTQGDFDTAIGGATKTVVNFDSVLIETEIVDGGAFDGLTFDYGTALGSDLGDDQLAIINFDDSQFQYDTTSGSSYLGGIGNELVGGPATSFTVNLPTAVTAISLQVIVPDGLFDPDEVTVGVGAGVFDVSVDDDADFILDNEIQIGNSFTYFVGVHDVNPFTSFTLNSVNIGDNNGFYGIDDITYVATAVPEPISLAALALLASGIVWRRQRKNDPQSD